MTRLRWPANPDKCLATARRQGGPFDKTATHVRPAGGPDFDRFLTNRLLTKSRPAKTRENRYKTRGFVTLTKCRGADCRCTGNAVSREIGTGGSNPPLSARGRRGRRKPAASFVLCRRVHGIFSSGLDLC